MMQKHLNDICQFKDTKYPYYHIYVKNYVIYYIVIDDEGEDKVMEICRFLYNKHYCDERI